MSIVSEFKRIRNAKEAIKAAIITKGVEVDDEKIDEYADKVLAIQQGGGSTKHQFSGHADSVGLKAIGWTDEDIAYYQEHGVNWEEADDDLHKVSEDNISLYTNATKVIVDGIEMASNSYLTSFRTSKLCNYLPKIDTSSLASVLLSSNFLYAIPKLTISSKTTVISLSSCYALTSVDVSDWDVSNVTSFTSMFNFCDSLTYLDVSKWNTSKATNLSRMFVYCRSLDGLDVSGWDVSNVTNMDSVFNDCRSLTYLDVSKWNTSKVTSMNSTFFCCFSLEYLDVSNWDVSNVTSFTLMFQQCNTLTYLDVSKWNTSKATNMYAVFATCNSIHTLDVSNWDVSNVTNLREMFVSCRSLKLLDLRKWNTTKNVNLYNTFYEMINVRHVYLSTSFVFSSITNKVWMPTFVQSIICSSDYDTIKCVFESIIASTMTVDAPTCTFSSNSVVVDDAEGTLATLKDECTAKGWTITNLTIKAYGS